MHISIYFNQVSHLLSFSENKIDKIDEAFPCGQTSLGSKLQPFELEHLELKMYAVGFQNLKVCI